MMCFFPRACYAKEITTNAKQTDKHFNAPKPRSVKLDQLESRMGKKRGFLCAESEHLTK